MLSLIIVTWLCLYLIYVFLYKPAAKKNHPKKKYRFIDMFKNHMDMYR